MLRIIIFTTTLLLSTSAISEKNITQTKKRSFPMIIKGDPAIHLKLDRRYGLKTFPAKNDQISHWLATRDGNSEAMLTISEVQPSKTVKAMIEESFEGASIKIVKGDIAGVKVMWHEFEHEFKEKQTIRIFSKCQACLSDESGKKYYVFINVSSASKERLITLREAMSTIQLKQLPTSEWTLLGQRPILRATSDSQADHE